MTDTLEAAILGAGIAGLAAILASWLTAVVGYRFARVKDRQDQDERRKAIATVLLQEMWQLEIELEALLADPIVVGTAGTHLRAPMHARFVEVAELFPATAVVAILGFVGRLDDARREVESGLIAWEELMRSDPAAATEARREQIATLPRLHAEFTLGAAHGAVRALRQAGGTEPERGEHGMVRSRIGPMSEEIQAARTRTMAAIPPEVMAFLQTLPTVDRTTVDALLPKGEDELDR